MKGFELLKGAFLRLGINNSTELLEGTSKRDLEFINQILIDLKITPITELSQEVKCNDNQAEAVCCGLAMLLSFVLGEGDKNAIYTAIYNAKRANLLCKTEKIEDVLPKAESGDL